MHTLIFTFICAHTFTITFTSTIFSLGFNWFFLWLLTQKFESALSPMEHAGGKAEKLLMGSNCTSVFGLLEQKSTSELETAQRRQIFRTVKRTKRLENADCVLLEMFSE